MVTQANPHDLCDPNYFTIDSKKPNKALLINSQFFFDFLSVVSKTKNEIPTANFDVNDVPNCGFCAAFGRHQFTEPN